MKKKTLTKAAADNLFHVHAILMGSEDGVPYDIAVDLLGADAVHDAMSLKNAKGGIYDCWAGKRGLSCNYLTRVGFFVAATLYNVSLVGMPNCQAETVIDIATRKRARSYAHKKSRLPI